MSYDKHYGSSEAYDGLERLYWLKELALDQDGRIIVKRILTNNNKSLDQKYNKSDIEEIRKRNFELESQRKGGYSRKRTNRKGANRKRNNRKRSNRNKTVKYRRRRTFRNKK
jgi:hypothetical protein